MNAKKRDGRFKPSDSNIKHIHSGVYSSPKLGLHGSLKIFSSTPLIEVNII